MSRPDAPKLELRPEQRLLDDLRAIGVPLKMIWETHHIEKIPPQAFKIIMHHLRSEYPRRDREGMARALARREARSVVWDDVISLYHQEYDDNEGSIKQTLAYAIQVMARPSDLDQVIELMRDPRNESSRVLLVKVLSRSKAFKAFEALCELQHDPGLSTEISRVLKRTKARRIVPPRTEH